MEARGNWFSPQSDWSALQFCSNLAGALIADQEDPSYKIQLKFNLQTSSDQGDPSDKIHLKFNPQGTSLILFQHHPYLAHVE